MEHIPFYVSLVFILTTCLSILLFYFASNKSKSVLAVLLLWLLCITVVGLSGFLKVTDTIPPRLIVIILPPLLLTIALFTTVKGRVFIDSLNLKMLTLLHSIRILVEIVLLWLFLYKAMPQLMTFEGRNFDMLSGLTAPVIYYLVFIKKKLGSKSLLLWNVACLSILMFTVTNAILSAPTPFQQFAFNQLTIAILYFPFVWLPGIVVPIVYFSHVVAIRRLLNEIKAKRAITLIAAG